MSVISVPFVIIPFVTISVCILVFFRKTCTKKTDSEVIERLKFWLR